MSPFIIIVLLLLSSLLMTINISIHSVTLTESPLPGSLGGGRASHKDIPCQAEGLGLQAKDTKGLSKVLEPEGPTSSLT